MILCGERINAATAERIGLVEEVVEQGSAKERALELASQDCPAEPNLRRLLQGADSPGSRQCSSRCTTLRAPEVCRFV